MKGWHKKRLSQKSPVDEKRSGRPSILRQVQKMVISKSVHKRGQNTRKLASKLTIWGPKARKTLSIYIWVVILEPIHAKGLVYAKYPKKRRKMTSVFQGETEVNREQTSGRLYFQVNVQCTCQCLKHAKMIVSGPKMGTSSEVQVFSKNHGLGRNDSFRCVQ